jgi:hypothetical protein
MSNPYGTLIDVAVATGAVLFVASLAYAFKVRKDTMSGDVEEAHARPRGYMLIGAWVLVPPLWFFFEFTWLHPNIFDDSTEFARVKYAQELARNVWLAFVVVLAAILGVKWPPG